MTTPIAESRPTQPPSSAVVAAGGLTVLLVEDDDMVRSSTSTLLRELGHRVLEAPSAEVAFSMLRDASIDVLMTDLGLPGLSGEVFAAEACAILPHLRIIFATGSDRVLAIGGGGATPVMLRKPYDCEEIAAALLATRA
jgi:DNA-binding response OmpR family regulator